MEFKDSKKASARLGELCFWGAVGGLYGGSALVIAGCVAVHYELEAYANVFGWTGVGLLIVHAVSVVTIIIAALLEG